MKLIRLRLTESTECPYHPDRPSRMVWCANIATHWHTQTIFRAEVVFRPCAEYLLTVVRYFRADEADHSVNLKTGLKCLATA